MKARLPARCMVSLIFLTIHAGFLASASPLQIISLRDPSVAASPGGNGDSGPAFLTPDGRFVLFSSSANNLALMAGSNPVPVLIPARSNVYLRDRTNQSTTLASVNLTGSGGGNGDSFATGISSNGQYAVFESSATNLVSGDTNNSTDVFVRDLVHGTTILVSVSTNGGFGNGSSGSAVITPDGRYVAFVSAASNLVTGDANGIPDIFVRDLQLQTTTLASPGAMSAGANMIIMSGNGSFTPVITPDGRYVAFYSTATNLVPGVANLGDIYVRDLVAHTTYWASTGARGQLHAVVGTSNGVCSSQKISDDGSLVAYEVSAVPATYPSLAGVVLRYNLFTDHIDVVNTNANAPIGDYEDMRTLDLSPDGRFVASVANTDKTGENTLVYLWDSHTGTNLLVSADVNNAAPLIGRSYAPVLDASGRYVAFLSESTNLTPNPLVGDCHLYRRDTQAGSTTLLDAITNDVGLGDNPEDYPRWSQDAQFLAFECANAGDRNRYQDIFVFDFPSNADELVSIQNPAISAQSPDGPSILSSTLPVSLHGQYVVFASEADNLVANDTNVLRDVFVRDSNLGTNILVSADTNGLPAAGFSSEASISVNGRYVAFSSSAPNLVPGDTNNSVDVFERDLQSGTTTLVSVNTNGSGSGNAYSGSPMMGSDGRFVLFLSQAQNLAAGSFGTGSTNLFLRDLQLDTTYALTSGGSVPAVSSAVMTPDGHYVAFIGMIAGSSSNCLYVWDSQLAMRVYTNTTPGLAQVAISPDGQRLAYSTATGLFMADRANPSNNATVGTGSGVSFSTQWGWNFSADGSLLVFETTAALAAMDTNGVKDVYLYNVLAQSNLLVSQNLTGTGAGDGPSDSPVISPDGRFVAYRSAADNLVPGDINGVPDVFLYDRTSGMTTLLSASQSGIGSGDNRSLLPIFSGDGQTVVFQSAASDLVTNDWNRASDVFAFNLYDAGLISTFTVQISPITSATQNPTLFWPVQSGKTYHVQFKNNLTDSAWQTLPGNVTILGNTGYFTDPTPFVSQRFYQITGQ